MKKLILLLIILVLIGSYTDDAFAYLTNYNYSQGGFWDGLWSGIISFATLPLSVWFPQDIHVYNSNNNGFSYNLGFFIPAISEVSGTIVLLGFAWLLRFIFWIVIFIIGSVFVMFNH